RTIMDEKYQLAAARTGQYGPLHPTSLTPEGMKGWLDPAVYPPTYELLYAEFLPRYGHLQQHVVPGYNKAWPAVNAALTDVFAGKRQARGARQEAVPRANQLLKEEEQRLGFAT